MEGLKGLRRHHSAFCILHYRVARWAVEGVVGAGEGDAVLDFVRQLAVDRVGGAEKWRVNREKKCGRGRSHQLSAHPIHDTIVADILHPCPKNLGRERRWRTRRSARGPRRRRSRRERRSSPSPSPVVRQ